MVLTSFANANVGEILDARDRAFDFRLNQAGTIAFKQDLASPQATQLLSQEEGYIKLYRGATLAMVAEITSLETVADEDGHSVACVATESMWVRLAKRLIGKSSAGLKGPTSATDQGTFLNTTLADLNTANNTGIATTGTITASTTITGGVWRYKPFLELVQELAASVNGFDFWQVPVDPAGGVPGRTGTFNIAPLKGTTKANVGFEYGDGLHNADSYQLLIDNSQLINQDYVLPPSFPDNPGLNVVNATDAASVTSRGLREEVVPSDLNSDTLRTWIAGEHILVRKKPRKQFVIQPSIDDDTGRVPEFLVDYTTGDTIRGRVRDGELLLLDATVRVYGAKIEPDDEGLERVSLTLVNEA